MLQYLYFVNQFHIVENGGEYKEVTSEEYNSVSATFKYNLDLADYAEGLISVTAVGEDIYGNIGKIGDYVCEYYVDHTAPEKPRGVKIEAAPEGGYITISWEQGKEEDLESYNLYRKYKGEISLIATKLKALSYKDREVVDKESYNYYVTAVDTTGHESIKGTMATNSSSSSDYNNTIENFDEYGIIVFEDIEKPQITSVSPSVNSMLPANPQISIKAKDNKKLKTVKLEYNNGGDWIEIGELEASAYAEVFYFKWDTSNVEDGTYTLRATAYDISGNASEPYKMVYILNIKPPTAPVLSGEVGGYSSILKWTASEDSDLTGYSIYRKLENQKDWVKVAYINKTEFTDKSLTAGKNYIYKVVAVDKIGNKAESNMISVIPIEVDEIAPKAVITSADEGFMGIEMSFSASSSSDNIGIVKYSWDFGDGTGKSNLKTPSYKYKEIGEYKVSLTVYDKFGNENSVEKVVIINDPSQSGTAIITVVDKDSRAKLSWAKVFVRCPDGRGEKFECDAEGSFAITGRAGEYEVCFYKENYLPTSVKITLINGSSEEKTAEMKHSKIVVGTMSVKRMSLEEIEAVGIDTDKVENQIVYKYKAKIAFEDEEKYVDFYANDKGNIYYGYSKTAYTSLDLYCWGDVHITASAVPNEKTKPTIVYMVMPGGTSWLKEFFEVKLIIDNQADEGFDIVNSSVTLNLPSGVSFIPTEYSDSETIYIGSIKGKASQEVKWVIRGDAKGEYDISADFTGILMPFEEELKAVFKTEESFRVYGSDALHMYIECPDYVYEGKEYTYKIGIKNIADFDVNKVKVQTVSDEISIDVLKPDEILWSEHKFVAEKTDNVEYSDIIKMGEDENAIEYTIKTIPISLKTEVYDDYRSPEIRGERVFAVTAEIYNQKNYDAKNVKAELIFNNPNDVEMIDKFFSAELIRKIESIKAEEKISLEWEFYIKEGVDLESFGYNVRISADGYEDVDISNNLDCSSINKLKFKIDMDKELIAPTRSVSVEIEYDNAETMDIYIKKESGKVIFEKVFSEMKSYGTYSFEIVLATKAIYYVECSTGKNLKCNLRPLTAFVIDFKGCYVYKLI